ncbi:hypothetical protein ASPZODRAFT_141650 [Penicilliopsis zonata CBS 506.65]|uniref:Geranylgeranyl pyrophosphate synthase n=1 Tax=Penicilliopsis zonata CBS 506.65 TaxID=1073090 RepID=A0A1L9SI58_9EURO|nr:hypothetical protein ASPZODRAFT_141650 [Penicilliopsis zonata CBS 506.65]OJJ46868.1 hypothetical protein ASPZODRAFT_141650 [Penicilliopsis zonata CBS 506.65]
MFRSYSGLLSKRRKSKGGVFQVVSTAVSEPETVNEPVVTWTYSRVIDDEEQKTQNGCFTTLPIRIHKEDHVAEEGSQRFVQDLNYIVTDKTAPKTGCLSSPVGNYASVIYPECLPDRLEVVAYLTELGYLHLEWIVHELISEEHPDQQTSESSADNVAEENDGPTESPRDASLKKLLTKAMTDLADRNQLVGLEIIDTYRNNWLSSKETPTADTFANIDEYVAFRRTNAGINLYGTLMGFSHGTRFTKEDYSTMTDVLSAAERAIIFTNDYYSWAKKRKDSKANVILFLMQHEDLSVEAARERTKQLILQSEYDFVKRREALYKSHPDLAPQLRKWAEVLGAAIGGVHYWCANTPLPAVEEEEPEEEVSMEETNGVVNGEDLVNGAAHPNGAVPDGETVRSAEEDDNSDEEESSEGDDDDDDEDDDDDDEEEDDEEDGAREGEQEVRAQEEEAPPALQPPIVEISPVQLDSSPLVAPIGYTKFVSASEVQSNLMSVLNIWLQVPSRPLSLVKQIVDDLHSASLMLNNIQDNQSSVQQGKSAAHLVFGPAQSMNSAAYTFVKVSKLVNSLNCPGMLDGLLEELELQFIGQSWDLNWRFSLYCPSEAEYMAMIDRKAGSTFKVLTRLMQSTGMKGSTLDFDSLTILMGRWHHIRDDYLSLQVPECKVLDQGKLSYPIVRCCETDPAAKSIIFGLFRQNHDVLPADSKVQILELLHRSGALQDTYHLIRKLADDIEQTLKYIESVAEEPNAALSSLVASLEDVPVPGA